VQIRSVGLTDIYNLYNSTFCFDQDIVQLRALQRDLDHKMCEMFGWDDIDLDHNFYPVPYLPEHDCIRFTISEFARSEILQRLSRLNSLKHQDELNQSLRSEKLKSANGRARRSRAPSAPELTLNLNDFFSTTSEEGA
jgi:MoaA/NifB/PqqE/SkfB family radical SAM enzyme